GKSALADDPRSSRPGAFDREGYRALGGWKGAGGRCTGLAEDQAEDARPHSAARGGAHAVLALPPACAGRIGADDRAGVFLQRDLFHLALVLTDFYGIGSDQVGW